MSILSQSVAVLPPYFAISVVPHFFCCRPAYPPPPYPSLLSRISAIVLARRCLRRWHCLPYLLSRISAAPPLVSSRVSIAFLIALSSIVSCTLPSLFFYLLRLDFLLAMTVLYYTYCSALLHTNFLTLCSDIITTPFFYFGWDLFSLRNVLDPLRYAGFFFACLHSDLLQSYHSTQLCLLWPAFSISDILNSDCSAHSLICLLRSALISLLGSTLSFVPLGLLISLKTTYHCAIHHILLAYNIT